MRVKKHGYVRVAFAFANKICMALNIAGDPLALVGVLPALDGACILYPVGQKFEVAHS